MAKYNLFCSIFGNTLVIFSQRVCIILFSIFMNVCVCRSCTCVKYSSACVCAHAVCWSEPHTVGLQSWWYTYTKCSCWKLTETFREIWMWHDNDPGAAAHLSLRDFTRGSINGNYLWYLSHSSRDNQAQAFSFLYSEINGTYKTQDM